MVTLWPVWASKRSSWLRRNSPSLLTLPEKTVSSAAKLAVLIGTPASSAMPASTVGNVLLIRICSCLELVELDVHRVQARKRPALVRSHADLSGGETVGDEVDN